MKILYSLLIVFTTVFSSYGQTFEEWKKKRVEKQRSFVEQRASEYEKLQKDYQDFKRKRNSDFANYLEKRWKEMVSNEGLSRWDEPKPFVAPVVPSSEIPQESTPLDFIPPVEIVPEVDNSLPSIVIPPVLIPHEEDYDSHSVSYFGLELDIPWDPLLSVLIQGSPSETTISSYWTTISEVPYEALLTSLWKLKEEYELNDWAYFLLVENVSKEYCIDRNSQRLFQWFFLSQSAYDARIGFSGQDLTLLIPSVHRINEYSFLNIGGVDYYLLDPLESVFTYDKNFAGAENYFRFDRISVDHLGKKLVSRELSFDYKGKNYAFDFLFNSYKIEFDNKYLPVDFPIYFDAVLSDEMQQNLYTQLQPVISEMDQLEALQFLLSFVQMSFEYQTDGDQFGYENYLFADESIFYPYIDCEDRSFLFAKMVRKLLDLPVVGLLYPGHLSTAVALTVEADGSYIDYNNRRYFVCDPTYIGADIGKSQPEFKSIRAEIITVK